MTTIERRAGAGIAGLEHIGQVKLPVTDLARSVDWYRRFLDLRLWVEIVEDGVLRGAGLLDAERRFDIVQRDRSVCASRPNLDGFDVVAFLPAARSVLEELAERCDRLGIARSAIRDGPEGSYLRHAAPGVTAGERSRPGVTFTDPSVRFAIACGGSLPPRHRSATPHATTAASTRRGRRGAGGQAMIKVGYVTSDRGPLSRT